MSFLHRENKILITGGNGFIGSHVAQSLHKDGHHVRIVDIIANASLDEPMCSEFILGNLCDPTVCSQAVQGVQTVLHFAAAMGGMGTIHDANDFQIYQQNNMMTTNLLSASIKAGVKHFFFASSACVYPEELQSDNSPHTDVSLREGDVWLHLPPNPQGLYGLEKLNCELILQYHHSKLDIRIARFHNIYGPGGAWGNGREKAPAAMARKAIATKLDPHSTSRHEFEIWGDGVQRRSFLFIDDAVKAILLLLQSDCKEPVNIGSPHSIAIKDLADIALRHASIDPECVDFHYDLSKPIGVASRNSNNDLISSLFNTWKPSVSLENGMRATGNWIEGQLAGLTRGLPEGRREEVVRALQKSEVVDLNSERITFGIILPITSRRGGSSQSPESHPEKCLEDLAGFARSLTETTWRDTQSLGGRGYRFRIYLAIDRVDEFLLGPKEITKPEACLRKFGITDITTLLFDHPPGNVCSLWRDCAEKAWSEGHCDYITLFGDDVVLKDEGWMRNIHAEFLTMAADTQSPLGFGCVAFTDVSFPGMPTFPVISRMHMAIFGGKVVPDVFVNQDGDPFLFQLYRRWGCSRMIGSRISNAIGGSEQARYEKQRTKDWTFGTLDEAVSAVDSWLIQKSITVEKKVTLDVVVPCFRVELEYLSRILNLKPASTCTTMFIIIVDDPNASRTAELEYTYAHRPDVRIRVNTHNMGASYSRNRGMSESAADWIHFLDDDITPRSDLLVEGEKMIRKYPSAAGFVGKSSFPRADSIFTTAVHLAGVTYFWNIAETMREDVPWGVTANLLARRNKDGVEYDASFPKTGGGEDIDFCLKKRAFMKTNEGEGFFGAPEVEVVHPWWKSGRRSYWRFHKWSLGDGALVRIYPQHSYRDFPNSSELLLIGTLALGLATVSGTSSLVISSCNFIISVIVSNVIDDIYRHLWRHADRTKAIESSLSGLSWIIAVMESALIRMFSEIGRSRGMLVRREFSVLGKRFDWFTGRLPEARKEERWNSCRRMILSGLLWAVTLWYQQL